MTTLYTLYTFYLNEIICFSSILNVELKKSKEKSIYDKFVII